jgi:hypothetical protein
VYLGVLAILSTLDTADLRVHPGTRTRNPINCGTQVDGDLAKAEPKTLRYRILHAAGRLVFGGRKRRLKIQATWPWAEAITAAWQHINALPQAP